MATLRLVQLTDIHLTDNPGETLYDVETGESLAAAVASIQQLQPPADAILVTGDISETGSATSYRRFTELLQPLQLKVILLPGNHDDPVNMSAVFAEQPGFLYQPSVSLQQCQILCLESQIRGEEYGELSTAALQTLKEQLDNTSADTPVLVALHHTPSPVCPSSGCQLRNADTLVALLSSYPQVKAVIAGHTHNVSDQLSDNLRVITSPSTFAYASHAQPGDNVDHEDFWAAHQLDISRQGYRIIDLQDQEILATEIIWL